MTASTPTINRRIITKDIPVFAPSRIDAITATAVWTPQEQDVSFCVGDNSTTFKIGAGTLEFTPVSGQIIGIRPGNTFTFSTSFNLAVM